eukprot:11652997-Heterocapsa_arctica.AAC.1
MQEGTKLTGEEIEQDNEVTYQQHIAGEKHEKEDTNEVHAQGLHQMEEEANDTHIFGEQKENKYKIADCSK